MHIIINTIFYISLFVVIIFLLKMETKLNNYLSLVFYNKITKKINVGYFLRISYAIIIVLIFQKFFIGNFVIPTGSMFPLIKEGDRIFANMMIYKYRKPKRNEVIIFKEPFSNKYNFVKRVIGLPGDIIQIKNNKMYINGKRYKDRNYIASENMNNKVWVVPKKGDILQYDGKNYILNGKYKTGEIKGSKKETKVLNENYYFVLGDNTLKSYDSRYWGFLSEKRIKGKGMFIFFPINHLQLIN